jgi:predicted KAP-like P-loop ATPase
MRMMVADGSYEKILEAEKHRIKVISDKRISDLNDNINTEVQISTEKNRQRLEAELLANKELMEKIAKTQAELLQTAIDKWREEELAKINENPSAYIKTNNAS